jgi:hypothetical protein
MGSIWVRSQDRKSLILAKRLSTISGANGAKVIDKYVDSYSVLGEYPTEERALQVLDEIQGYIACGTTEAHEGETGTWRKVEKYGVVYIMPES